jgi:ElaB/YqjD/DUF883 family membrane-anchored ribosome-binding protein
MPMPKMTDGLKTASDTAKETLSAARKKASQSQQNARVQANKAIDSSKKIAGQAAAKTEQALDANPFIAIAGGLAVGLIAGALLPRLKSEEKLMGKSSKKLKKRAQKAAEAAKAAGKEKVQSLGLGTDDVRDQFRDLVSKAAEAVRAAGQAARDSSKPRD